MAGLWYSGGSHRQAQDSDHLYSSNQLYSGVPAPLTSTSLEYTVGPQAFLSNSGGLEPYC